jgi:hypothetical protein
MRRLKMKVKLKATLKPEVLEKLREILIKHKVEWEEEIIVKDESKKEWRKRFVTNRKGSYEI